MSNLRPKKKKMESKRDNKDQDAHGDQRLTVRRNPKRKLLLRTSKSVDLASPAKSALKMLRLKPSLHRRESKRVNVLNLLLAQRADSEI